MIGMDAASGQDPAIVSGCRGSDDIARIELMSDEDRAALIAGLNEIGRRLREEWERAARQLWDALQPTVSALAALHRHFEGAGLYELDPAGEGMGAAVDEMPAAFANWPQQGGTCAHVCGPDPDHVCDARAATHLAYDLPSGGTRSMPICRPCYTSETAVKEHADA